MDLGFDATDPPRNHVPEALGSAADCEHDVGILLLNANVRAIVKSGGEPADRVHAAARAVLINQVDCNFPQVLLEAIGGKAQSVLNSLPQTLLHFYAMAADK